MNLENAFDLRVLRRFARHPFSSDCMAGLRDSGSNLSPPLCGPAPAGATFRCPSRELGYVDTVVGNNNVIVHQLLDAPGAVCKALRIAEKFQGGGHANAAGATLPRSVRDESEAVEYMKQVLNPAPVAPTKLNALPNNLEELFNKLDAGKR